MGKIGLKYLKLLNPKCLYINLRLYAVLCLNLTITDYPIYSTTQEVINNKYLKMKARKAF